MRHEAIVPPAKFEKEQALARMRQLQTGQLEGRLLDREEVRAQWSQAFAALRDRALGMADRIATVARAGTRPSFAPS
jgi:hypothetical protein